MYTIGRVNLVGQRYPKYYADALTAFEAAEVEYQEFAEVADYSKQADISTINAIYDAMDRAQAYKDQMYAEWQASQEIERN